MKFIRPILLAVVVAIALLGGLAQTAYADSGRHGSPGAAQNSTQCDPSDPLFPPD